MTRNESERKVRDSQKSKWMKAGEENKNPIDCHQSGQWGSLLTMEQLSSNEALIKSHAAKETIYFSG